MASAVVVFGPCNVYVGTGSQGAYEELGWTADGVYQRTQVLTHDVPGDERGGEGGAPIDVQYLGEIYTLRCELTKYDAAIADKLRKLGSAAGVIGSEGTLFFGGSKTYKVKLSTNVAGSTTYEYQRCFVRQPIEVNKGTKFSRLIVEFECHADGSDVVFGTSTVAAS